MVSPIRHLRRSFVNPQRGYTLVELIVVLVVVSIIAGGIVIYFHESSENSRLVNASYRVLADIRYAQEMAMSHNRQVDFAVDGNTYSARWNGGEYIQSPITGSNLYVQFGTEGYGGVEITSGSNFSFDSNGKPSITSETVVVGLNSKKSIKMVPNTGYVYIEDS